MAGDLPTGLRGKLLASAITVLGVVLLWLGVVQPLIDWNADLAQTRAQQEQRAGHMQALADSLPALQARADSAGVNAAPASRLISGNSDAVAAASLQELIQDMARRQGVTLTSVEALPAEPVNRARRIGLRLAVRGELAQIMGLLQTIEQATPRMLVDDVSLQQVFVAPTQTGTARPMDASFAVIGFRAATP